MPTILRRDGFRFYFFSDEGREARHVHVDRAGGTAKLWLRPDVVARNIGFNAPDLATIVAPERFPLRWNRPARHPSLGFARDEGRIFPERWARRRSPKRDLIPSEVEGWATAGGVRTGCALVRENRAEFEEAWDEHFGRPR